MIGIGCSEIFLVIILSILLIDRRDVPSIIKNVKLIFNYLESLKKQIMQTFKSIEESVEIDTIKQEIDFSFTDFSKEYIEPTNAKQINKKKSKKNAAK